MDGWILFFATTTEHTFQGTRYWGDNQGGVGYEIFSGFKTKKRLIIKVKGREGVERWSYTLKSDGEMSMTEHLLRGVKGSRGEANWKSGKRKCKINSEDSLPVRKSYCSKKIYKKIF